MLNGAVRGKHRLEKHFWLISDGFLDTVVKQTLYYSLRTLKAGKKDRERWREKKTKLLKKKICWELLLPSKLDIHLASAAAHNAGRECSVFIPCSSTPGCCSSQLQALLGLREKVSSSEIPPLGPILHSLHTQVLQKQWDSWMCGKCWSELAFVSCWWITLIWIFVCRGQTLLRSERNITGKTSAIITKKDREKHHWCKPWNK